MLNDIARALNFFQQFSGRWDEQVQLSVWAYKAMKALKKFGDAGWRAYSVAFTLNNRNDNEKAAFWADRCAEMWKDGGNKYEQAEVARLRALIAISRKDYEVAEQLLQEALAICRDLALDETTTLTLKDLGTLARAQESYDVAEGYLTESLELSKKTGNKDGEAIAIITLGNLERDRAEWSKAREWYEQGLILAEEVRRIELIAHANFGLARVNEADGYVELALSFAKKALKIFEQLHHSNLEHVRELIDNLSEANY
jgi:tetratricopeptide (TPR) repeat protein